MEIRSLGSGQGQGGRQLKGGGREDRPSGSAVRRLSVGVGVGVTGERCTCYETKIEKLLKQRIECSDVGRGFGEAVVNRRRWQRVPSLLEQDN
jgi:hypothetical protein